MLDRVDSFPYFASPFFLTIGVTKQADYLFFCQITRMGDLKKGLAFCGKKKER